MKRELIVDLLSLVTALTGVVALCLWAGTAVGILLYLVTGAIAFFVLSLVAKDIWTRVLDKQHFTWRYWGAVAMILASVACFLLASVSATYWLMITMIIASVVVGILAGLWIRFCSQKKEGEIACGEDIPDIQAMVQG